MEVDLENSVEVSDIHHLSSQTISSSVGATGFSINDDFDGSMVETDNEAHVLLESILSKENFMIAMKLGETRLGFELRPEQLGVLRFAYSLFYNRTLQ